jgi:ubiquinone/menaquinone biosynthesis C-methylase UbiE
VSNPPMTADEMDAVRNKFSHGGAAGTWHAMYAAETERLDEANFRLRRDVAVDMVLRLAPPQAQVIDLGCGAGPVISELRKRSVNVVGLDYAADMLDNARSRLRALGLDESDLYQGDCRRTPYPDASFDVVVCLGVISYIDDYADVLREIHRLLRPGGTMLVSFRNVFNPILSDPLALGKFIIRKLLHRGRRNATGATEKFQIGRFLDYREVTGKIDALGFEFMEFAGIGFGPFCIAGRRLFSERRSIALSRWLAAVCTALRIRRPLRWLADVSLWVYRKPDGPRPSSSTLQSGELA